MVQEAFDYLRAFCSVFDGREVFGEVVLAFSRRFSCNNTLRRPQSKHLGDLVDEFTHHHNVAYSY